VEGKDKWRSFLKRGFLYYDADKGSVDLEWESGEPTEVSYSLAAGGRGMELSELVTFDGHLLTVDDRTGVIYRLSPDKGQVVPWLILADGDGQQAKGFKGEWFAVKDEHLYVGGLGKEWTTPDGEVLNFNPMHVKRKHVNCSSMR